MRNWSGDKLLPFLQDIPFGEYNELNTGVLEDPVARFYTDSFFFFLGHAAYDCDPALRIDHSRSYEHEVEIHLPPNDYLPDIGGRWKGLLITSISKTVVQLMRAKFEKRLEEVWSEVSLQFIHFRWKSVLNF
jgi:hypothetical protein